MYNIYKITNTVNGLIYIGCTTKDIDTRMKGHKSRYRNRDTELYKAMRKYGFDKFTIEVIESGSDDSIRYSREKYFIDKLNAMNPSIGYNMTIGGLGTVGYTFTDEAKKKISLAGIGRKPTDKMINNIKNLNKGKHLSEEVKSKISKSRLGKYTGEDNPFYGRHHSEESIAKAVETKKNLGILRPVMGVNLKTKEIVTFDSLAEAVRFVSKYSKGKIKTLSSHIANSIMGRCGCKSAYGYKWSYIETSNDYPDRE